MSTFTDAIEELRKLPSKSEQGLAFEKLMVNYFKTDPTLSSEYSEVYRWVDWPFNGGKADTGIDLVARRVDDGEWTAIQCKFYMPTTHIQKGQLDSFFEASGRSFETDRGVEQFANRLIISTTDRWSSNAEAMLENQLIATNRIGTSAIAESPINWDIAYPGSEMSVNLTLRETFEPRPHQATAIEKSLEGFKAHDRGKLIMACGTGKTFTALRLAERFAQEHYGKARVLFLVPSISLLSQSLKEWTAQARMDLRSYAVCSDSKVARKAEDIASYDLEVPVSTNGTDIAERLSKRKRAAGLSAVFSTYQSLPAIHDAQEAGLEEFDLVICDEAHRTTGATLAGEDPSNFSRIHDNDYIKAKKRLYMTATPRLFDETVKGKAIEHSAELYSMDDEAVYGPEFHRLGFGEAVDKGLLTDYKVLIMTVDESLGADAMGKFNAAGGKDINLTTGSAMIGVWNALAKRSGGLQGKKGGFDEGAEPMHRTVAFAKDIKTSKAITEAFPLLVKSHRELLQEKAVTNDIQTLNMDLDVQAQHVDGAMNALERSTKLTWLESDMPTNETRVLTNARCLSEGVDVPALDSVVFFNPRNSMVDVVQSVGRVMRKAEGKDYGYIILPVAVAPDTSPSEALNDNQRFKVVWQILNALRAHDDRFNAKVNSISLNENLQDDLPISVQPVVDPAQEAKKKLAETERTEPYESDQVTAQQIALFSLEQWQEAIYTKLVDKVGTRTYWEDWADDVADISKTQVTRIRALLDQADATLRGEFDTFVEGLRGNLNDSISEDEAISMLSQHLITAPVFDALFSEHDFAAHNPVSQVMQRMVDALDDSDLDAETDSLEKFYASVRVRASEVTSASGKQQVIKELYERFFQKAFKRDADKLGIVYTPVEIVDFILRAANDVSKKHFDRGLTDESVHILDPFTGTGTFMVRLLQSGLIDPKDLERKYANELHATEIMLLAYYVAAANIETTFNALLAEAAKRSESAPPPRYVSFEGIALADTFQIHEEGDILDLTVFRNNNERIVRQKEAPINVIVGNPPYSSGQKKANDNNANLKYPTLDARIAETYAAKSTATNKNSLYDSYLRAFRWATDRIGDHGVVAFIANNGWVDGNTGDGVRLSMAEDFTDLYIFNLRGNSLGGGEQAKREGDNVFDIRVGVAVLIGVKDPSKTGFHLHYAQTPDYQKRKEKLAFAENASIDRIKWRSITPNQHGDWLNQRSAEFGTWPVIGEKKSDETTFFTTYSSGLKTGRDSWSYSSSTPQLVENIETHVANYDQAQVVLRSEGFEQNKRGVDALFAQHPELIDSTQGSWNVNLKQELSRGTEITLDTNRVYTSMYRPFFKQRSYFAKELIDRQYQLPSMFPTQQHHNIGFAQMTVGAVKPYSIFAADMLLDLNLFGSEGTQFFPRFTWELVEASDGALFGEGASISEGESSMYGQVGEVVAGYVRKDNITDAIKAVYRDALGADVTGDDIFHFVYGKLHDPNYREAYAADLKKMLPHIETPGTREEFDKFARAGKELMDLHVGYEDVEPYPLDITVKGDESDPDTWRVLKMKWGRKKDPETGKNVNDVTKLIYNKRVTITGIPAEADEYMLGSRSAVAWLIDRYQVKKDKASGIVNDPNDWSDEVGNPRYIVDLIGKVTRVAVETVRIVEGLRE
ncbi:DEAD/DEAH box helicase [Corynebacterium sp. CCUG 18816]|uniref:DEAD/DEAH box helicase n=1 Tax=Corynebacterium pseudogenitalium TaxID=38303 RepID=UPI00210A4F29|nr:DEAD/DEAH box helicase [Corynebacterium pseudogenitalium]MCQ4615876.1 DEAD/DEAH box helicase [Corynebacterium pseudogenitalium]